MRKGDNKLLISIISFLLVIAVCVIVHEYGHYMTAKWLGVQSHEFAFGMGPVLVQRRDKSGMLWSLRAFPIGGFVRLAGMGEEDEESDEKVKPGMGFNDKSAWRRFLILANGSLMNIVLAILLTACFLYGHGVSDMQSAKIGELMPGFPAEQAGFLPGDKIVEVNGTAVNDWRSMTTQIRSEAQNGDVNFKIDRAGEIIEKNISIPVDTESKVPLLGITPSIKKYTAFEAATGAWSYVISLSAEMLRGMWRWITGAETMDIAGPVGIASMAGEAARSGVWNLLTFLSLISLNLGILNLFPFPALDGGRLFIIFGEMIFRRRLPEKVEYYIHAAGFFVLISLILFVTWQDISRLVK